LDWLSLFKGGSGNCMLPFTPPSTGLSRIKHLTLNWQILKHQQMCSYSGCKSFNKLLLTENIFPIKNSCIKTIISF
jgi:hypothetical protein